MGSLFSPDLDYRFDPSHDLGPPPVMGDARVELKGWAAKAEKAEKR
jgi:hypothetical protein